MHATPNYLLKFTDADDDASWAADFDFTTPLGAASSTMASSSLASPAGEDDLALEDDADDAWDVDTEDAFSDEDDDDEDDDDDDAAVHVGHRRPSNSRLFAATGDPDQQLLEHLRAHEAGVATPPAPEVPLALGALQSRRAEPPHQQHASSPGGGGARKPALEPPRSWHQWREWLGELEVRPPPPGSGGAPPAAATEDRANVEAAYRSEKGAAACAAALATAVERQPTHQAEPLVKTSRELAHVAALLGGRALPPSRPCLDELARFTRGLASLPKRTASRSAQIALALLAAETAAHLRLVLALDEADPIVLGGLAVDLADSAGSAAPFFVPGGDDAVLGHLLGIATVADAAAGEGSGPVLRSLHLQALSGMVLFRLGHSPLTCAKLAPPPSADQGEGHGHGRVRPERQLALLVATSGHAVHQVTEARAKLALALFHLHVAAHEGGAAGADAVLLCESLGYEALFGLHARQRALVELHPFSKSGPVSSEDALVASLHPSGGALWAGPAPPRALETTMGAAALAALAQALALSGKHAASLSLMELELNRRPHDDPLRPRLRREVALFALRAQQRERAAFHCRAVRDDAAAAADAPLVALATRCLVDLSLSAGDAAAADAALQASQTVFQKVAASPALDEQASFQRARAHMAAGRHDLGAAALAALAARLGRTRPRARVSALSWAAKAHHKRRDYHACRKSLAQIRQVRGDHADASEAAAADETPLPTSSGAGANGGAFEGEAAVLEGASCLPANSDANFNIDLGELQARNLLAAGRYGRALEAIVPTVMSVEAVVEQGAATPEAVAELGRLYGVRAKIEHAACLALPDSAFPLHPRPLKRRMLFCLHKYLDCYKRGGNGTAAYKHRPAAPSATATPRAAGDNNPESPSFMRSKLARHVRRFSDRVALFWDAAKWYKRAWELHQSVQDEHRSAKVALAVARLHLEPVFVPVALLGHSLEGALGLGLGAGAGGGGDRDRQQRRPGRPPKVNLTVTTVRRLALADVERASRYALDTATRAEEPLLLIEALVGMSEVLLLSGQETEAAAAFVRGRDMLFLLFVDCVSVPVVRRAPPSTSAKLLCLAGRLVRMVGALPGDDTPLRNVRLLDTYALLELDVARCRRRAVTVGNDDLPSDDHRAHHHERSDDEDREPSPSEQAAWATDDGAVLPPHFVFAAPSFAPGQRSHEEGPEAAAIDAASVSRVWACLGRIKHNRRIKHNQRDANRTAMSALVTEMQTLRAATNQHSAGEGGSSQHSAGEGGSSGIWFDGLVAEAARRAARQRTSNSAASSTSAAAVSLAERLRRLVYAVQIDGLVLVFAPHARRSHVSLVRTRRSRLVSHVVAALAAGGSSSATGPQSLPEPMAALVRTWASGATSDDLLKEEERLSLKRSHVLFDMSTALGKVHQFLGGLFPENKSSSAPLTFVVSKNLQMVPWESFGSWVDMHICRTVSVFALVALARRSGGAHVARPSPLPRLLTLRARRTGAVRADQARAARVAEAALLDHVGGEAGPSPAAANQWPAGVVVPKPLRNALATVDAARLGGDASTGAQLRRLAELLASPPEEDRYGVVVLGYADLLELAETTTFVLARVPQAAVVFVPTAYAAAFVSELSTRAARVSVDLGKPRAGCLVCCAGRRAASATDRAEGDVYADGDVGWGPRFLLGVVRSFRDAPVAVFNV